MKTKKTKSETSSFEKSLAEPAGALYELRLYVAGMTPRSTRAIKNIKDICEEYLEGRYDLKVFDIYKQVPTEGEQVIAVPTLIKTMPQPLRRLIGDLSDQSKVLLGLDLKTRE